MLSFDRMRRGVQQNYTQLSNVFLPFLADIVMNSIGLLVFAGPVYFANLMATLGAYFLVTKHFSSKRKPVLAEQVELDSFASNLVSETFQNAPNIKSFGSRDLHLAKYAEWISRRVKVGAKVGSQMTRMQLYQRVIITTGVIVNLMLSLSQAYAGTSTVGSVVLVGTLMMQVLNSIPNLGMAYLRWQESFADINELLEVGAGDSLVPLKPDAKELEFGRGVIEFRDVNFSLSWNRSVR